MFKYLLLFIILLLLSCSSEKKEVNTFKKVYTNKVNLVKKTNQFKFNKLELMLSSGNFDKNEAQKIIDSISKKYENYKKIYSILLLNKKINNFFNKKFYNLLLKFQEYKKVQKFLYKNFLKDVYLEKTYFLLRALDYKFTKDDYKDLFKNSRSKNFKDFIEINYLKTKIQYCHDGCSYKIEDKDKYINKIDDDFYSGNFSKKYIYRLKKLKKKKKKLEKKLSNLKNKELNTQDLENELEYYAKAIEKINNFLNIIIKRKLDKNKSHLIIKNLLINKTPLNKNMTLFILSYISKEDILFKTSFYEYLKNYSYKVYKNKRWFKKKLDSLLWDNSYVYYLYKLYKEKFPEKFKKLNPNIYSGKNFLYVKVRDFKDYYLNKLEKDINSIDNLKIFQYYPDSFKDVFKKYFDLYSKDNLGNKSIIGKEDNYFTILKIALKGKFKIDKDSFSIGNSNTLLYFNELEYFFIKNKK